MLTGKVEKHSRKENCITEDKIREIKQKKNRKR
jgi:hypothetical protein